MRIPYIDENMIYERGDIDFLPYGEKNQVPNYTIHKSKFQMDYELNYKNIKHLEEIHERNSMISKRRRFVVL